MLHTYRKRLIDRLHLYLIPSGRVGTPYPGAVEAVQHIKQRYGVEFVALSARWSLARRHTENWLMQHGLEDMNVVLSSHMHPRDETRSQYKYNELCKLRQHGKQILLGIGDRPSDLRAYVAAGIPTIMLSHNCGVPITQGNPLERAQRLVRVYDTIEEHLKEFNSYSSIENLHPPQGKVEPELPPFTVIVESEESADSAPCRDCIEFSNAEPIWGYVEKHFERYINESRRWLLPDKRVQ